MVENKELKLTINIVPFKEYHLKCLRVLSLGLYSLIFLSVIFFFSNYADDNTSYCSYKNFGDVITCLERTADDLFAWFNNSGMKANAGKCHFLLSAKEKLKTNISNY